ncbi:MAG: hypothetical protein CMB96_04675 [Flavobacteriaceae bacterium]|nr:hypothetical protein [Flavobacteriaceae bacterium]
MKIFLKKISYIKFIAMKISLLRKKKAPEEGLVTVVAKSLNNNSKAVNKTMSGVKAVVSTSTLDVASSIASAVPPLIQSTLADPAKFIGIQISYYIDYILVSFVTAFSVSYFFNSSPSA